MNAAELEEAANKGSTGDRVPMYYGLGLLVGLAIFAGVTLYKNHRAKIAQGEMEGRPTELFTHSGIMTMQLTKSDGTDMLVFTSKDGDDLCVLRPVKVGEKSQLDFSCLHEKATTVPASQWSNP